MACGNSVSSVSVQMLEDQSVRFPCKAGNCLLLKVPWLKSIVMVLFIRKSHPRIAGADRLSTTMKSWSTSRPPRRTFKVAVPTGEIFLPSALISFMGVASFISCGVTKSLCITEQEAPESSIMSIL